MSSLSLETLGFTQEELQDRVVERIVQLAMREKAYTYEGDYDGEMPSTFAKKLQEAVETQIQKRVDEIAEKHVHPQINHMIENLTFQQTNQWGEKKGASVTFVEYMVDRANEYLTEKVNYEGKGKNEVQSYSSWSASTTRIAYMLDKHFQYTIETAMKDAVKSANQSIVEGIVGAVKVKLSEVQSKLKVEVKA